jgi:hypothetical protein
MPKRLIINADDLGHPDGTVEQSSVDEYTRP